MTFDPTNPPDIIAQPDHPLRDVELDSPDAAASINPSPPPALDAPLDAAHYNRKAKQGLKLMLGRQAFIQVFTFAGGIVLARTLTPEIFGIFGISMFLVSTLALFGDFGLAPSLIQRKEDLTEHDLQVAFTLQQILLTTVAVAIWIAAPFFLRLYPDFGGPEYVWLIRVMAFTLFLQSWRSMSVLQMERHLDFKRIAWIEIVEALSFQALAVGLAVTGFGIWSLVWATLARGLLGTTLAYTVHPWRIRMAWDTLKAKQILSFGLPFQAGSIMSSIGGWVTPLLVGTFVGPAGVGFLTWAGSNGRKPLVLLDPLTRVAFPHFSRLQNDVSALVQAYKRYLFPPLLLAGLWVAFILVTAADLVPLVYTNKWVPAITALYIYASVMSVEIIGWVTGIISRSTGHIGFNVRVQAVCTFLSFVLAIPLVYSVGFMGVPIALLATSALKAAVYLYKAPTGCGRYALSVVIHVGLITTVAVCIGSAARMLGPTGWLGAGLISTAVLLAYMLGAYATTPRHHLQPLILALRRGSSPATSPVS